MTHEIQCADCGADHTARRSDARYCPSCSLLRLMLYALKTRPYPRRCRACRARFRPLHVKDLALCGACGPPPRGRTDAAEVTCALCAREAPPTRGVPVCLECIKTPEGFDRVLKMLRAGKRKRKRDNAPAAV